MSEMIANKCACVFQVRPIQNPCWPPSAATTTQWRIYFFCRPDLRGRSNRTHLCVILKKKNFLFLNISYTSDVSFMIASPQIRPRNNGYSSVTARRGRVARVPCRYVNTCILVL